MTYATASRHCNSRKCPRWARTRASNKAPGALRWSEKATLATEPCSRRSPRFSKRKRVQFPASPAVCPARVHWVPRWGSRTARHFVNCSPSCNFFRLVGSSELGLCYFMIWLRPRDGFSFLPRLFIKTERMTKSILEISRAASNEFISSLRYYKQNVTNKNASQVLQKMPVYGRPLSLKSKVSSALPRSSSCCDV